MPKDILNLIRLFYGLNEVICLSSWSTASLDSILETETKVVTLSKRRFDMVNEAL